ncbi:BolA family protein [Pelagibacterium nitratireducens]|jgi:BolA family transcriptional regulator, general stress-responsive regulator|uniref:BolA family protein n=1 Tax=Pelagibacterium nitratireducens TaxID=1046114 RepID=A0ABZ2I4L0_9HYPH|nr:BolA family transcriptional regulator [Pelagibacterium sp.]HCO55366.1 BolA family transcriptional regulator [Pelagibacterium sp.]|tara:strand:+ start:460 stop:723 length:264 start_codon:yes stop_codon:yes gene_type:complete
MSVRDEIEAKLTETFAPVSIEVIDDSERHHGHAGWREGGNTHFRITIASEKLDGLNRVDQHRAINAALADQFDAGLHALAIKVIPSR